MEKTLLQKIIESNVSLIDEMLEDLECQKEGHFTQFGHNARNAFNQETTEEVIKDSLEFLFLLETKMRTLSDRLQEAKEPVISCRHCKKETYAAEKCFFCLERPHDRMCIKQYSYGCSYNDCTCQQVTP